MSQELKIVVQPNKILRQRAREVAEVDPEIRQLILKMKKTMKKNQGLGLAAPQIAQSIRVIVVQTIPRTLALINPEIISRSWRKELGEEGCLSIPQVTGQVRRAKKIKIKAWNQWGKTVKFQAEGMFSRVLQHEIDHLNGILFIDKAINIQGRASEYQIKFKQD